MNEPTATPNPSGRTTFRVKTATTIATNGGNKLRNPNAIFELHAFKHFALQNKFNATERDHGDTIHRNPNYYPNRTLITLGLKTGAFHQNKPKDKTLENYISEIGGLLLTVPVVRQWQIATFL
jgi:hypothetical protein